MHCAIEGMSKISFENLMKSVFLWNLKPTTLRFLTQFILFPLYSSYNYFILCFTQYKYLIIVVEIFQKYHCNPGAGGELQHISLPKDLSISFYSPIMCDSKKLRLKFGAWQLTSPGVGKDWGGYDQIPKIKIWLYNFMIEMKVVRNVILNKIDPHDQPFRLHRSPPRSRQNFPDSKNSKIWQISQIFYILFGPSLPPNCFHKLSTLFKINEHIL